MKNPTRHLILGALAIGAAAPLPAATINQIANAQTNTTTNNGGGSFTTTWLDRDNSHQVQQIVETFSWVDGSVSFDYELLVDYTIASGDANGQIVSFTGPTWSKGVQSDGGNGALDDGAGIGESLTFTIGSISNVVGAGPGDISFDGFTSLGIFFADGVSDAGAITNGLTDIWSYDGPLGGQPATIGDPAGAKITGSSTDDGAYSWFGHSANTHAQVNFDPTSTLSYEVRSPSDTSDVNRVRLNNVGLQFTVVPEPSVALLGGLGLLGLHRRRR